MVNEITKKCDSKQKYEYKTCLFYSAYWVEVSKANWCKSSECEVCINYYSMSIALCYNVPLSIIIYKRLLIKG